MHNASCDGGHSAELLIKSAHSTSMRLGTCQLRKRVRFMIQKNSNKKVLKHLCVKCGLKMDGYPRCNKCVNQIVIRHHKVYLKNDFS